jgi:hypothetical protein
MTNAPTREEREAIRARVEKATPGPWLWGWSDHLVWLAVVGGAASVICRIHNEVSGLPLTKEDQDNAAFIAAARYDVPRLLEALEEAERKLDKLITVVGEHMNCEDPTMSVGKYDTCGRCDYCKIIAVWREVTTP